MVFECPHCLRDIELEVKTKPLPNAADWPADRKETPEEKQKWKELIEKLRRGAPTPEMEKKLVNELLEMIRLSEERVV